MSEIMYTLNRLVRRNIWHPSRQVFRVIHPLPFIASLAFAYLFATNGQMHELYIVTFSNPDFDPINILRQCLAVLSCALLCAVLYFSNYSLSTNRIDLVYAHMAAPEVDNWLRGLRNAVGLLVAAWPCAGILWGLSVAAQRSERHAGQLNQALNADSAASFQQHESVVAYLGATVQHLNSAFWLGLVISALFLFGLHALRRIMLVQRILAAMTMIIICGLLILPETADHLPERLTAIYQTFGSLSLVALSSLAIYAISAAIALLSGKVGFPLVSLTLSFILAGLALNWPAHTLVLTAMVVFTLLAITAMLARHYSLAGLSVALAMLSNIAFWSGQRSVNVAPGPPQSHATATVSERFAEWLFARQELIEEYQSGGQRYPVFIIAAQGGGIYAAAAASEFLARLQKKCPAFAQHVFAISAVSGGAVGAALFNSQISGRALSANGCGEHASKPAPDMSQRIAQIILNDHLSPLLGFLLSDLVNLHHDRAKGLMMAFVEAAKRNGGAARLKAPFTSHWDPSTAAPALVLNTTSVETGHTVAFAPFNFGAEHGGTILSFSDTEWGLGELMAKQPLIEAAITSARFPGVVPAFSVERPADSDGKEQTLNFVDGSYSDSSAAATGRELFKILRDAQKEAAQAQQGELAGKVDLRLLILTSAEPKLKLNEVSGTTGRDSIVPLWAVLSVRDRLGAKAVRRAVTDAASERGFKSDIAAARGGRVSDWSVAVIELDQEAFELTLGWTISPATKKLVDHLLGDAESCKPASEMVSRNDKKTNEINLVISQERIRANSCVQHAIVRLLNGDKD